MRNAEVQSAIQTAAVLPTRFTVPPSAGIFLAFTSRDQLPARCGEWVAEDTDMEMLSQIGTKTERLYSRSDSYLPVNKMQ